MRQLAAIGPLATRLLKEVDQSGNEEVMAAARKILAAADAGEWLK